MLTDRNDVEDLSEDDSITEDEYYPQRLAHSRFGVIATAHEQATAAGIEILQDGGNAMDAAVAAAYALGVCEPMASGLGGQTMMLLHLGKNGNKVAIDGSSRAPNRATPGLLRDREMRRGLRATTVPSTPAVLEYVRRSYGSMTLERVLKPAIRLAVQGYRISNLQNFLTRRAEKFLRSGPAGSIFLKSGEVYPAGSLFKQPVLAETLHRLLKNGVEDFYTGEIAADIYTDMQTNNGLLHEDDLARIPWPIERRPVSGRFRDGRLLTFPPPGSGRVLIEMLNILNHFKGSQWDLDTPRGALILAEIIRQAQLDRRDRPYDPSFYPQVQEGEEHIITPKYARQVAHRLKRQIKTGGETTHLSVMDKWGNAVALTQSIERVFGACTVTPGLGFLYNNYMSAFEYEDISHPYYLRPNAAPWASVTPTIVFHGRHPWVAIGSAGSERIAPAILQVLLRMDKSAPLDAVSAPRMFCSINKTVHLEVARMRSDIPRALLRAGYQIKNREPFSFFMGCVQMVMHSKRGFTGVADIRRDGSAGGI